MRIAPALLHQILALPRKSVLADLELVLRDSILRFNYFDNLYEKNEDVKSDFAIHALYLLGELEAKESLPVVFEVLSQHQEYYDFYFGEWIHAEMWEPIYKMSNTDLKPYKQFMLKPDKYTYAKNVIIILFEQIVIHQPERKNEVTDCYKQILKEYNNCSVDDNIIDSELIAYIACSIVDMIGQEAGEVLKPLFDKEWVSTSVCGSYSDLLTSPTNSLRSIEIMSLDKRYIQIADTWYKDYTSPGSSPAFSNDDYTPFQNLIEPVVKEKKVGRNDPCICGSGKKYKKCCL